MRHCDLSSLGADVIVTNVDILDSVSVVFTVKDEKSSFSSDATTALPIKLPNCTFFAQQVPPAQVTCWQ